MSPGDPPPSSSIAVVYGTRPEMIKLAPLIKLMGPAARLIHTGQHYDAELSEAISLDLGLASPAAHAAIGGQSRASQIGLGVVALEPFLAGSHAVIVQGDTNSSLAGALTANAMEIPLFHVEAGLRSFDREMPEEHNRVLIDHLADMCWAPTDGNVKNLMAEGIQPSRVEQTGNTIVEALEAGLPDARERKERRNRLEIPDTPYALATIHRPENVDDPDRLAALLDGLANLSIPVVFPIHPRTVARVVAAGLETPLSRFLVRPPVDYRDFLSLLTDCAVAISDSGGIQEEVSVLKRPLVVVRRSTERPEVLGTFASLISEPGTVVSEAERMIREGPHLMERLAAIDCPFGDGRAAIRMMQSLMSTLDVST